MVTTANVAKEADMANARTRAMVDEAAEGFVDIDAISQRWACSRPTVIRRLNAATVPVFHIGKLRRYRWSDVLAFERQACGKK